MLIALAISSRRGSLVGGTPTTAGVSVFEARAI